MESKLTPQIEARFCRSCDMRNEPGALFCVECGQALDQAHPYPPPISPARAQNPRCGSCGIANPHAAVFCVHCGRNLSGAPVAPPLSAGPAYAPALAAPGYGGGAVVQHIYVSAPPAPAELPLLLRAVWFLLIGLWLGPIWLVIAWLFNLTLIGLPVGLWMLHLMPQVMTLRQERRGLRIPPDRSSASFAVRAIYFVLIGWWLSLLWLLLGWAFAATVIGLPLAFVMFERVNSVMTLADQ